MQLIVSSSLEGRDLALLKSVINILHSDYVEEEEYSWLYQEKGQHQVFISQDFYQHGTEYYALLKEQGKRISIGANINPKNLRLLFDQIANGELKSSIDTQSTAVSNDSNSLLTHVFRYMSSQVKVMMEIKGLEDTDIIIDKENDQIWSNVPLNQSTIKNELFSKPQNIKYLNQDKTIDTQVMRFNTLASHFLWHMGMMYDQQLISPEFTQPHVAFKQTHWPDYGCLKFKNSFISMSALLWRRAETFEALKNYHNFDEQDVISFLNAACLSASCVATKTQDNKVAEFSQAKPKPSGFLSRLKQKLFGQSA